MSFGREALLSLKVVFVTLMETLVGVSFSLGFLSITTDTHALLFWNSESFTDNSTRGLVTSVVLIAEVCATSEKVQS